MKNACDCITSGNLGKPKQHGADPHAKDCAIYLQTPVTSRCLVKDDDAWKAHEHFCSKCFGHGKPHNSGWWRCLDKKCVRLPSTLCKKHEKK